MPGGNPPENISVKILIEVKHYNEIKLFGSGFRIFKIFQTDIGRGRSFLFEIFI
jgi:hypothetical protein